MKFYEKESYKESYLLCFLNVEFERYPKEEKKLKKRLSVSKNRRTTRKIIL